MGYYTKCCSALNNGAVCIQLFDTSLVEGDINNLLLQVIDSYNTTSAARTAADHKFAFISEKTLIFQSYVVK